MCFFFLYIYKRQFYNSVIYYQGQCFRFKRWSILKPLNLRNYPFKTGMTLNYKIILDLNISIAITFRTRDVCETLMPPSLRNIHEENEWTPQIIRIFLSPRDITLSKIA